MAQRLGALTALPEAPVSIPTSSQLSVTVVLGHPRSSSGPCRESEMHVAHRCTYNPNTATCIIIMMIKNNSNSRIFRKKATTWKKLNFQNI